MHRTLSLTGTIWDAGLSRVTSCGFGRVIMPSLNTGESTEFALHFANVIYKPSYISLHTALSFYGIIPEAVPQITSVTTLKTIRFSNDFGEYSYKNIKPEMMFGYDLMEMEGGRRIMFATPEKALADMLYLYPFYDTEREIEELRLDEILYGGGP